MDFRAHRNAPGSCAKFAADAWLLVLVGSALPEGLEPALASAVQAQIAQGDFALEAGKLLLLRQVPGLKAARFVVVAARHATPKALRAALASAMACVKDLPVQHLAVQLAGLGPLQASHAEAVAAAAAESAYVYRHTKPSAPPAPVLAKISFMADDEAGLVAARSGLARGAAVAEGVALARELANRPGNHCTPTQLAAEAKKLARANGLKAEVLDARELAALGMGSFLAVARGSEEPPRFIVLRYQGAPKQQAPLVLVGKGITFDSGGISLKPSEAMDEMKFDMGGAASVLGTLHAVAMLKPRVNLIGVVAACENLPSGRALKPGDVVTSLSGQTIEVLNTDAEGRLILCDALSYVQRFKPAAVVDIATLTGACVVALGHVHTGLFSADEALAAELLAAGERACDTAWRMPLDEDYEEGLKTRFADVANVAGRAGGAITAAVFLKRFVGNQRWAHLDIAGTAWKSGLAKGATGRPVGLLTHWVLAQAAAAERGQAPG